MVKYLLHECLVDGVSLNENEIGSRPNDSSPRGVDSVLVDHQQKQRVHPYNYFRSNSSLKIAKNQAKSKDSTLKSDGPRAEFDSVSTGEASTVHADEIGEDKKLTLDHCGILPNACLPCLSSNALAVEKRRPQSPDTPSSRRKSLSKLSFKWREGSSDTTLRECSTYFFTCRTYFVFWFFCISQFCVIGIVRGQFCLRKCFLFVFPMFISNYKNLSFIFTLFLVQIIEIRKQSENKVRLFMKTRNENRICFLQ